MIRKQRGVARPANKSTGVNRIVQQLPIVVSRHGFGAGGTDNRYQEGEKKKKKDHGKISIWLQGKRVAESAAGARGIYPRKD